MGKIGKNTFGTSKMPKIKSASNGKPGASNTKMSGGGKMSKKAKC